jgi:sugar lactone lactonase YvrE
MNVSPKMKFLVSWLIAGFPAMALSTVPCFAKKADAAEVIAQYDENENEFPEGIAIDKRGNIFVSFSILGVIDKIEPNGTVSEFAVLDPAVASPFGVLGLAVDAPGNVYAAVMSGNAGTHGVWRVSRDGQDQELLPGTGDMMFPNSLAFDKVGNLYVTDSFGAIWRIPPGGVAEMWLQHPLLGATPPPCGIGANGIAYRKRNLYVANTCEGLIVRVPVEQDGTAGIPEIVLDANALDPPHVFGPDGIALDVHGMIYTVNYFMSELVRVSPDEGTMEILASLADGDPISAPASLAFGTGKGERKSIFITNFALFGIPPGSIGPSVVKIPVKRPGLPLP